MKYLLSLLCFLFFLEGSGQALRDINYSYLYDPDKPFEFDFRAVRHPDTTIVFYRLQVNDTARTEDFIIHWGLRESLSKKENLPDTSAFTVRETSRDKTSFSGSVTLPVTEPRALVAKVIHVSMKRAWLFYQILQPVYPQNEYLISDNEVVFKPFINISDSVHLGGTGQRTVSYYDHPFPAALPPFAESQGPVSKGMNTDSTFQITAGTDVGFSKRGLYLIQKDTTAAEGLAFRVEDDYPKLATIQSLAGPLIYICTKMEYERLTLAKNDKRSFDRIVLSITSDTERARKLIRNYFRRVELANRYFTSYKEGWKTDRGMIYMVFGLPDEVFRFSDREVWSYKNDYYKVTFNFARSSSLFDPDNYVLIREKKFRQTWYEVIDLWRKARF